MATERFAEIPTYAPTVEEGHRLLEAFIRIESTADRERLIAMAEAMMRDQPLPVRSTLKH